MLLVCIFLFLANRFPLCAWNNTNGALHCQLPKPALAHSLTSRKTTTTFSWAVHCFSLLWRICISRMCHPRISPFQRVVTRLFWLCLKTSETKQKTLEEIAAAFGDRVILPNDADNDKDRNGDGDEKPESQRVEVVVAGRDRDWFSIQFSTDQCVRHFDLYLVFYIVDKRYSIIHDCWASLKGKFPMAMTHSSHYRSFCHY